MLCNKRRNSLNLTGVHLILSFQFSLKLSHHKAPEFHLNQSPKGSLLALPSEVSAKCNWDPKSLCE